MTPRLLLLALAALPLCAQQNVGAGPDVGSLTAPNVRVYNPPGACYEGQTYYNLTTHIQYTATAGNAIAGVACVWTEAMSIPGITSLACDGVLLSCSSATGAVALSQVADAAYTVLGNPTASSGAPGPTANPIVSTLTSHGSTATDSAGLGTELTTSACSGTGWTGTYPNYVAPGTTAPLTCPNFTSGSYYQTVTSIGAGGTGAVTIAIGTAQTASGSSGTVTAGLKANGTSLTYTPASTYTGTIGISAKLITPISVFGLSATDSTGATSVSVSQGLATLHNVCIGGLGNCGIYNTTGNDNVSIGYEALLSNTTGYDNTANGFEALLANTTGYGNTANGYQALLANTTGSNNTANGYEALLANTSGSNNTANGYGALSANTSGPANTATGFEGLLVNTTGYGNTANGYEALQSNTTGVYNSANGYEAGRFISGGSTANQTSSGSVYLGCNPQALANADVNEIIIGGCTSAGASPAVGAGSNTTVLGNVNVTDTYLGSSTASSNLHAAVVKDAPAATPQSGTSGTVSCAMGLQGSGTKIATCYLNGYANTGTAQTYAFPTAFSAAPVVLSAGSTQCTTSYPATATASTATLPANASMTAGTCNIVFIGQ